MRVLKERTLWKPWFSLNTAFCRLLSPVICFNFNINKIFDKFYSKLFFLVFRFFLPSFLFFFLSSYQINQLGRCSQCLDYPRGDFREALPHDILWSWMPASYKQPLDGKESKIPPHPFPGWQEREIMHINIVTLQSPVLKGIFQPWVVAWFTDKIIQMFI